jgi:F-type H+-transporting ATPase subunit b
MVEINLTIIIQVVQFLILVYILNRILFKPISQTMDERHSKIVAWEEKTRTLQERARTKIASYERELEEARGKAQKEQEQMSIELSRQEEERLQALFDEALQMVASTKQAVKEETARLRQELRQQAQEVSQMVAEKVLGRKMS